MNLKLLQLAQRIRELESLADEVVLLAKMQAQPDLSAQPELSTKGQRWYRGARELMVQQKFSGLAEFELCYIQILKDVINGNPLVIGDGGMCDEFLDSLYVARALLLALVDEIESRELPVKTQLSFEVSSDEFDRASELVNSSAGDEILLRAGGVVGRVALERHLWTVLDSHGVAVEKNPPTKKKADTQDLFTTLVKASVVTPIQKSEMDSLFTIGNNCAHPKEAVNKGDVERLISRGRELASVVL
jgi:hypothetical protein